MLHWNSNELRWINSAGGPLLLVSGEYLPFWGGVAPPPDERLIEATFRWMGPGTPATDYDRACDVQGYLGLLDIGAGHGLVLGDAPDATAWQAFATFGDGEEVMGGILIRCVYANSDADVRAAVDHLPESAWVDDG